MVLRDREGVPRCIVEDPNKDLLMETDRFRLYLADGRLLRLAKDVYQNGLINAEAEILKTVGQKAKELDRLSEEQFGQKTHYDWLIPALDATFLTEVSQGLRQANLLTFPDLFTTELAPLPKLKAFCDIDCKTAAWVLGRFYKLQAFLERIGVGYDLDPVHTLVCPRKHRLVYIGLAMNTPGSDIPVAYDERNQNSNVKTAALEVLTWVHPELRETEEPADREFLDLVRDFSEIGRNNGAEAHRDLYATLDRIWGVKYHPFTYYVKSESTWKTDTASTN